MDDGVAPGSEPACVGGGRAPRAPRVAWSAAVAEAVVAGAREGLVLRQVCARPGMPAVRTVVKWAAERPEFGAALRAAREAAGLGMRGGPRFSYCVEAGEAICARLCLGEAMISILRDVEMPGYSTVYRWLKEVPAFAEAVGLARELQGQRLAEIGWEDACSVTPETAYALKVKLEHLRWYAGKLSPRKYGRVMALPPAGYELADAGRRAPAAAEAGDVEIELTQFRVSPSGQVMAIPPSCEKDEDLYLETYGRPYDGPHQGRWRRALGRT